MSNCVQRSDFKKQFEDMINLTSGLTAKKILPPFGFS